MSLDKFGRQLVGGSEEVLRGPKGEGFVLTPEGDYDMQSKKLCNLASPSKSNDAVTLDTLNKINNNNLKLIDGKFDANKMTITNIGQPKHDTDAVSVGYFKSRSLAYNSQTKEYDAKSGRIINLSVPQSLYDAVNYKYLSSTLASLSYAIYCQLHKNKKNLKSFQDWSNLVVKGNANWNDLFTVLDKIPPSQTVQKTL